MSDQDFNFNSSPRREAKAFEPPPWEADKFDELARRKEAEKIAAQALAEKAASAERLGTAEAGVPEVGPAAAQPVSPVTAARTAKARTGEVPEDPRVEAMMIGLKNEDPPFGAEMWKVPVIAGAVLAAVGAILLVWGAVALAAARRTGVTGSLGGGILIAFGLGFVGVGAWMAFRILRQQGVL